MKTKTTMQPLTWADYVLSALVFTMLAGCVFSGLTNQPHIGAMASAVMAFLGWWSAVGFAAVWAICLWITTAKQAGEPE